ncbi:MAG: hypothetical protein SWH61_00380 [Thermodesulfobacteriota bacterium]|nr:hypothetical protein [Thermodesulfobacteriota bacterium]
MSLIHLYNTPPWEWPRDAGKMIFAILCDETRDMKERIMAAELAGDVTVIDDHMAETLLAILQDNDQPEALRCQAAISLGPVLEETFLMDEDDMEGFEDEMGLSDRTFESIQHAMRNLYVDAGVPQIVRRRVLEASVRAPSEWHRNAVRAAFASGDHHWQLTAVFCMGYVNGFDEQILEALQDDQKGIRYEAICAAGNRGLTTAWPYIAAILEDKEADKDLLLAAIDAVATTHPERAEEILAGLLDADDQDVADTALESLFMSNALLNLDDEDLDDFIDEDDDIL